MTDGVNLQHPLPSGGTLGSEVRIEPGRQRWSTAQSQADDAHEAILGKPSISGPIRSLCLQGHSAMTLDAAACNVTLENFHPDLTPVGASGAAWVARLKPGAAVEAVRALLDSAVRPQDRLIRMDRSERSLVLSEAEGEHLQAILTLVTDRSAAYADMLVGEVFRELMEKRKSVSSLDPLRFEPVTLGAMLAANLRRDQLQRVTWTRV
jgi:hypothetical protein